MTFFIIFKFPRIFLTPYNAEICVHNKFLEQWYIEDNYNFKKMLAIIEISSWMYSKCMYIKFS